MAHSQLTRPSVDGSDRKRGPLPFASSPDKLQNSSLDEFIIKTITTHARVVIISCFSRFCILISGNRLAGSALLLQLIPGDPKRAMATLSGKWVPEKASQTPPRRWVELASLRVGRRVRLIEKGKGCRSALPSGCKDGWRTPK